tara:strand:+ start:1427 stop:1663 length:237 start_codon:yes stop_codon:yes gene_type:complete
MAKYDNPEVLEKEIFNVVQGQDALASSKQNRIKMVREKPSGSTMKSEEIQIYESENDVNVFFKNSNGQIFSVKMSEEL